MQIIKIGGNIVDNPEALASFLEDFAAIPGRKILVHGGGKEATRLSSALGIATRMHHGRRITDRDTLDVVTMVYAGLVNKRIVAALQARGVEAVGLSGADGNALKAVRRSPEPIDFGYVGDLCAESANVGFLSSLADGGKVPVMCAICHDGLGTLLNCNADSVAAAVAEGMAKAEPTTLTYCFEQPGVMLDIHDPSSVIPAIDRVAFQSLLDQGVVAAGMIPKLTNALASADAGVEKVRICHAADILSDAGTVITA